MPRRIVFLSLGLAAFGLVALCGLLGVVAFAWLQNDSPKDHQEGVQAVTLEAQAHTETPTQEIIEAVILPQVSPEIIETANPSTGNSPTRRPPPQVSTPLVVMVTAPPMTPTVPLPTANAPLMASQEGCSLMTIVNATVYVRDYPNLDAGETSYILPDAAYQPQAVAHESDGTWYFVENGWVHGSVADVFGTTCASLPDASHIVWRSMGHVDFQATSRYREVSNIRVEAYMQRYPVLIFENGTIWYNPNFQ